MIPTKHYLLAALLVASSTMLQAVSTTTITSADAGIYASGFTIGTNTTMVWNANFIVNGDITFTDSSSILELSTDLHFGSRGILKTGMNNSTMKIDGKGYALHLGRDIDFSCTLNLNSNLTINGNGHRIFNLQISGNNQPSFTLNNTLLNPPATGFFTSAINATMQNVSINLNEASAKFFAASGSLSIKGNFSITGAGKKLVFFGNDASSATLTFTAGSIGSIMPGVTCTMSTDTANSPTITMDTASMLYLNGCTLESGASGTSLDTGIIAFDHKVNLRNLTSANEPNTDAAKKFNVGSAATLLFLRGAKVVPTGLVRISK